MLTRILVSGLVLLFTASSVQAQGLPSSRAPEADDIADREARRVFIRGLTEAYLEDYEEAVALYKQALEAAPQNAAILSALSEAEANRENLSSAIYYARAARTQAPETAYYHLELARLLRASEQPRAAVEAYQDLLARFPGHTEARLSLARLQTERGRPRRALRNYEALVDSADRVPPEAYTEMLDLYQEVDDADGLERTLKRLIFIRPETPRYRRLLGQLYTEQGRYQEAIPLFEALFRETPRDPRVLSQLKVLYTETNQPEKAETLGAALSIQEASPDQLVDRARMMADQRRPLDSAAVGTITQLLRRALDRAADHPEALDLLGTLYYEQGRYAEAAAALRRALDADPRDPERWRRAASASLRADSVQQAIALTEEGLLLFPGRSALLGIEGHARLRLHDPEAARIRFREALAKIDTTEASPHEQADLLVGLGRAQHQLGNLDSAAATYETALRQAPDHADAQMYYARTLARQERALDRALQLAQRALRNDEATAAQLGTLGWVHSVRGEYAPAAEAFEKALSTGDADAWVYERFGDLQRAQGNDALARRYWEQALERAGDRPSLRQKLRSVPQS